MYLLPSPNQSSAIVRTSSPWLDSILGMSYPVHDHGFIRVIDYMGDDYAIDDAARTSYGEGTKRANEAQGLINTLMRDRHTSPFEMCEIKLHIRLPIFVMRQLVRHRMASLNEYSARYSVMRDEFYLPPADEMMHQSIDNKQGRAAPMFPPTAEDIRQRMAMANIGAYELYSMLIDPEIDLARELARINLPVSIYTECYWKIDLHNLFNTLMLRNDPHAQKEIRDYFEIIDALVQGWVPKAHRAFKTYRQNAITFSAVEQPLMLWALTYKSTLDPESKPSHAGAMSKREWKAFVSKIARITEQ